MRFLLLIALVPLVANSQKHTISGYVSDRKSQEKLIGAIVYDTRTKQGTTTNAYGFFSLTLPADSVNLLISYIGYSPQNRKLMLLNDQMLNVLLAGTELETVEIVAEGERIEERNRMSTINIPIEQVKKIPAIFGEVDLMKVLQLLPGVKSGGDGSTGIYVRGGGPDQNLILLDGAPVYNASHLFGFFSTFNADAIKNVELIKGGFPARYGGRLSSVIDINMKDGNMKKFNAEGGIGIISSRIMIEGPIWRNRTSFIVTARRTYIDALTRPIIRASSGGEGDGGYYFYDLNAKVNHRLSDRDRVYLSFYNGNDKFYFRNGNYSSDIRINSSLQWGNTLGALRWNHVFNSRLFSNTSVTFTRYRFRITAETRDNFNNTRENLDYFSGINDWAGRTDFEFTPSPDHAVRFGGSYIYHTFSTGAFQFKTSGFTKDTDTLIGNPDVYGNEASLYIEDDWKVTSNLKVNGGVHGAGFFVQDNFYHSVQPRISARYLLPRNWSIKGSYATMMQFIHLLTNSNIGLPTDLWVPATKKIKPQTSSQIAGGLAKSLKRSMYEISIEGYYKFMDNIIDYLEGADFIGGGSDWESKVAQGKGWSYGAEVLLQKKTGKYTGWIGYTLSWTDRHFAEVNNGKPYPYKYDRRHDVSVVNMYKFSNKFDIAFTWVYGTGNAVSLPLQSYQGLLPGIFRDVNYYGSKNNYRMAPYHRFDLSANRHKKKRWGVSTWSFGVYNLYARQNPYFLYFRTNQNGVKQLVQVSLFSIIPSISWNFKFDFRHLNELFKDDEELAEFEKENQ
jgi:hypothetical protein